MTRGEQWRPVNLPTSVPYEVSNAGRVRSVDCRRSDGQTHRGVVLKPEKGGGYPRVRLSMREGRPKSCLVHRLVAEAWVPNPEHKPQVNHIDGNTANAAASNLEWVTDAENKRDAIRRGRARSEYVTPPRATAGQRLDSAITSARKRLSAIHIPRLPLKIEITFRG